MPPLPGPFTARVVSGYGQGKVLGVPTLNLDLSEIPPGIPDGEYACRVHLGDAAEWLAATVHSGPRPVFDQGASFEVHVIDRDVPVSPATVEVALVQYLREVRDFPSVDALKVAIADDIRRSRAILGVA